MDQSDDQSRMDRNRKLVESIYACTLDPSQYQDVFSAWDKHFEALVEEVGADPDAFSEDTEFDWANEFVTHFEQAGAIFDQLHPRRPVSPEEFVEQLPYAALICNSSGRVIGANSHCRSMFAKDAVDSVFEFHFDAASVKALRTLLSETQNEIEKAPSAHSSILRWYKSDEEEPHILIAGLLDDLSLTHETGGAYVLVRSISAVWSAEVERTLAKAFELTQAEVELIGNLYKGLSIREISDWKGRSQATLRTQLSAVLQKTGTKSQSALLRIVVGIVHMILHRDRTSYGQVPSIGVVDECVQRTSYLELSNGLTLEYVESGDLGGRPFYFIQPTTTPTLTPRIVEGLHERGVRLISPIRPGNGRTTRTPLTFTPADWAASHLELIDSLGIEGFACGGHCSGGVYAVELARLAGGRCRSTLLVDTGAPLKSAAMIYSMPPSPRRLFLASRFFPRATVTPIKYVAADFHSSPEGEARGVAYFYEGSPADQEIVNEADNWRITRDNIDYCFYNVPQLARDVALWARNNTAAFTDAARLGELRFFHGGENLMMRPAAIKKFCSETSNTRHTIVSGRAQLLIYVEPDLFVEEIANASAARI